MKDADRIPSNRFTGACSIAALASCACLVACTPEDVVVFIVPDAHEDPSPPGSGGATNRPNDSAHGGSSVEGGGAGGAQSDSTAAGGEGAGGEADSSSDHHNGGRTCASNDDCPGSWFCAKSSCDAETGVCEVPPANCPDESRADHVCGCDGAMYWSDCVRKQNLVPASKKDYCSADARPCSTHEDCAQFGGFCARLTFGSVDCSDVGTCWGLPSSCPSPDLSGQSSVWVSCDWVESQSWSHPTTSVPMGGSFVIPPPPPPWVFDNWADAGSRSTGTWPCVDLCSAIRKGERHHIVRDQIVCQP